MNIYIFFFLFQLRILSISSETVSGCTINTNLNQRQSNQEKTSVTLSCANNGYILVRNLTFGVHKASQTSTPPVCSYQAGDCTTRTTYIGMECNGLTTCDLDLNPQYLHICSQYSDYMVLDYSCLQGPSLSVCDTRLISNENRLFLRSPNYPQEYENSLNCSCRIEQSTRARLKFLDFYLEERDENNVCSRDVLQIANRSFCGSTIDDDDDAHHTKNNQFSSLITLDSSFDLTFKTNDVITRKGFWLMIDSDQPLHISCNHQIDFLPPPPPSSPTTTTSISIPRSAESSLTKMNDYTISTLATPITELTSRFNSILKRRHTLSFILILTIIFVAILILLNLLLIILCWRQRRAKKTLDSKPTRPFICSSRSSSSSITYGETPVLTSLDPQKQATLSSRYICHSNQPHLETTPSTSTTTATGPYEDLNDSLTFQRQHSKSKMPETHSLYMQNHPTFSSPPATAYNRMIHFPPVPIRCHFSTPVQTFYPPQPCFDSQHIYETIQDGQCPYQRLAATLRRQQQQQQSQCTCYCEHKDQTYPIRTEENEIFNPETLV